MGFISSVIKLCLICASGLLFLPPYSILLTPFLFPLNNFPDRRAELLKSVICCTRTTWVGFFRVLVVCFFFFLKSRFFSCFKCLFAQVCSYEFLDTGNKKLARLSMNSVLWNAVSWHSRNSVISVPRARCCLLVLSKSCSGSIKFLIQCSGSAVSSEHVPAFLSIINVP